MRDAGDILVDNWSLIERLGHIVTGRTNDLYSPLEGCVVGLGPHEGGQERMMNVDDLLRIASHKLGRENLHIPGQHNELNLVFLKQRELLLFRSGPMASAHRSVVKGYVVEGGQIASVLVITDHQGQMTGQLPHLMAVEKIDQAMLIMRNEDGDAGAPPAHHKLPGKSKFFRQ